MKLDPNLSLLLKKSQGVSSDSRSLQAGQIYVAIRGSSWDGHQFIADALDRGAIGIVGQSSVDPSLISLAQQKQIPFFSVENPNQALGWLAAGFYDYPSREMLVVGITGTSGKTTSAFLMNSVLEAAGHRTGMIGTVSWKIGSRHQDPTHTTPPAGVLQSLFSQMKNEGCTAVVMEVSSHALKQERVAGICFDGAIFTNLSPEHLDYHPDMEDYFETKKRLFTDDSLHGEQFRGVVNGEDEYGKRLLSLPNCRDFFRSSELRCSLNGIQGAVELTDRKIQIHSPLIAPYNRDNILGVLTLAESLSIDRKAIAEGISRLESVPGRLEQVRGGFRSDLQVLVDYAHKPDALEKTLQMLREELREGQRLITVFGCGGDRDRAKRPLMGEIAARLSDEVWITSDNPRTEDPQKILSEIEKGVDRSRLESNVFREGDRRVAIHQAIQRANPGDLVLIAGKGHETVQVIGVEKRPFDDREVARIALAKRNRS